MVMIGSDSSILKEYFLSGEVKVQITESVVLAD
jgi:hypothetical protein